MVEHFLAKEKVTSSSLVARSKMLKGIFLFFSSGIFDKGLSASYNIIHAGDVAKWEGMGLQNPDHGFKSRRRL